MAAGFDGVEIHGANGFLLDQFLQDGSNHRTDAYGGTIENRTRLLLEVIDGIRADIGAARTAVRLSPHGNLGGLSDSDTVPHFSYVIGELGKRGLAYLHLIEPRASSAGLGDDASIDSANNAVLFRRLFAGPMITAGGYTTQMAIDVGRIEAGGCGCFRPDVHRQSGLAGTHPHRGSAQYVRPGNRLWRWRAWLYRLSAPVACQSGEPDMSGDQATAAGQDWLEIIRRPTPEAFASAFTEDVALVTSVASAPIVGAGRGAAFLRCHAGHVRHHRLQPRDRRGLADMFGMAGQIPGPGCCRSDDPVPGHAGPDRGHQLFHSPFEQVMAFSAELAHRLDGQIMPSPFAGR